jgi:hypothetical protein
MTRLFCVGMVLLAVVAVAAPALASIPSRDYSTVTWMYLKSDGSAFICPKCHTGQTVVSKLDVTVRDQTNKPMPNESVFVYFSSSAVKLGPSYRPLSGCAGKTDVNGYVRLDICGGVAVPGPAGTSAISTGTTVKCLDITIYENSTVVRSPDMTGDKYVEGLDFNILATDWLSTNSICRSNFDAVCPGPAGICVEGLDFNILATYWLEQYP